MNSAKVREFHSQITNCYYKSIYFTVNTLKDLENIIETQHSLVAEECQDFKISPKHSRNVQLGLYVIHLLKFSVINNTSVPKAEEFSARQIEITSNAIEIVAQLGLTPVLPENLCPQLHLRKDLIYVKETLSSEEHQIQGIIYNVKFLLSAFAKLKALTSSLEYVLVEILAGIVTVEIQECHSLEDKYFIEDSFTAFEALMPKEKYVKCLFILKSNPKIPNKAAKVIHTRLMDSLQRPGGVKALADNLIFSESGEKPLWEKCEVVAKIVANKHFSKYFHLKMVNQIWELLQLSINNTNNGRDYSNVCISCLNNLLSLKSKPVSNQIEENFTGKIKKLANPEDVLSGLVVYEHSEVDKMINILYSVFRNSKVSSLKSSILVPILPILYQLWVMSEDASDLKSKLNELIIHCLANREETELKPILEAILFGSEDLLHLHERIRWNSASDLVIVSSDEAEKSKYDYHMYFADFLKKSNNNNLMFNIFIEILAIFVGIMDLRLENVDLIDSEDDLESVVLSVFERHFIVLPIMTDLLAYRPFHFQFSENPTKILDFLKGLLSKKIASYRQSDDQIVYHILSIFKEIVIDQEDRHVDEVKEIKSLMRELMKLVKSESILYLQLTSFLENLESRSQFKETVSKYNLARDLCSDKEPYLRVYGMKEITKLIKTKDSETLSNLDPILLLALDCVRDEDSYVFLASIQLLVLLTGHLESTVIETLVAEFQDDQYEVDNRLKIGEAIVKVVGGLGEMAIKYKDLAINCFLHGVANKVSSDEFRVSCLYNLGLICKILSYQIPNFFNELIEVLKMVFECDKYLPARRAAALLLHNLIEGMSNLVDFQEFLLPIYRLLKQICQTDEDEKTRVHAGNGLKCLEGKIKESLTPNENLVKEIKILGVKSQDDKPKSIFHIV